MPIRDEKTNVTLGVKPTIVGEKEFVKDVKDLLKKTGKLQISMKQIAGRSQAAFKEISHLSDVADEFGRNLSRAAKDSVEEFKDLGKQLQEAAEAAEEAIEIAKSAGDVESAKAAAESVSKLNELTKQYDLQKKASQSQLREVQKVVKSYKEFSNQLEGFAKFKGTDMVKGLGEGLSVAMKSPMQGITKMLSAAGKGATGVAARGALSGMEGGISQMGMMAKMSGQLATAAVAVAGAAAGIGVLWKVLEAVSDNISKMNKALTEGIALAGDWGGTIATAERYSEALQSMRNVAYENEMEFRKLGSSGEGALKAISVFAKESTGSLIQTHDALLQMGKGEAGIKKFATSAMLYGKALGITTEEVAQTMGTWVSEFGVGSNRVLEIMGSVAGAARDSSMPVHKFMDIFRQVTPHLDLFSNRIEQLTGTIKLLSKNMSPGQVRQFMDAFAKGFKGVDFRQRLKTAFMAGPGFVSSQLAKDFSGAAKDMGKSFEKYGLKPGEFEEAFKSGGEKFSKTIAKLKAGGAEGAEIGRALETRKYEQIRRKGDVLSITTAMKKAGMVSTFMILKKQAAFTGTGLSGLGEHVMDQMGISKEQQESMLQMEASLDQMRSEIRDTGLTTNKSVNDQLILAAAQKTGIKGIEKMSAEDIRKNPQLFAKVEQAIKTLTDEEILRASDLVKETEESKTTLEDVALKQYNETRTLSEKVDDVISALMSKIYPHLEFIVKGVEDILNWLMTGVFGADTRKKQKEVQEMNARFQKDFSDFTTATGDVVSRAGQREQFDVVSRAIVKGMAAGKTGSELGKHLEQSGVFDQVDFSKEGKETIRKEMASLAKEKGIKDADWEKGMGEAIKEGDIGKLLEILGKTFGPDAGEAFMRLAKVGGISTEAKKKIEARTVEKREVKGPGTMAAEARLKKLDTELAGVKDIDPEWIKRAGGDRALAAKQRKVALLAEKQALESGKSVKEAEKMGAEAAEGVTTASQADAQIANLEEQNKKAEEEGKKSAKNLELTKKEEKAVTHMDTLMTSKGIKLEPADTGKIFENAMYKAISRGLMEFTVILASMWDDKAVREKLASDKAFHATREGASLGDLIKSASGATDIASWDDTRWDKFIKEVGAAGKQLGTPGPIETKTGLALLHRGEKVLTAAEAAGYNAGGGSPTIINNTIIVKGTSPMAIASEVKRQMSESARRH